jgi:hypothetical protein
MPLVILQYLYSLQIKGDSKQKCNTEVKVSCDEAQKVSFAARTGYVGSETYIREEADRHW